MRKGKEKKEKMKERRNVWPDRETSREAGTTDTERQQKGYSELRKKQRATSTEAETKRLKY